MDQSPKINRREFLGSAATIAASISIVPAHVIAGTGHIPPSDKLAVANIGCGTQGLREMSELLLNPKVRVVAVCDVNKLSSDYIDWSEMASERRSEKIPGGKESREFREDGTLGRNTWKNTTQKISLRANTKVVLVTRTIGSFLQRKKA
jgi:hypothetical protein